MTIRSDRVNPAERQVSTHRKPYHTPRLEDYGEVRELTRAAAFTSNYNLDTGSFPYVYSSAQG